MADTKISALTEKTVSFTEDEVVALAYSSSNYKMKLATFHVRDTAATSGTYTPMLDALTVNPSSASTAISVAGGGKATFSGTADVSGAGHLVGSLGWGVMNASGRTVGMIIGAEGKIDVTAGTVTTAVAAENQLTTNTGTIGNLILSDNQIVANSGTITNVVGVRNTVTANSGTVTTYYGVWQPDLSGVIGSAARYSFFSEDTAAPLYNRSAIIDASQYATVPTSGSTVTTPNAYSYVLLLPDATLATLTIDLPSAPVNGQELTFRTTYPITSLTINAGSGKSIIDSIATMAVNSYFKIKYLGSNTLWYRIG